MTGQGPKRTAAASTSGISDARATKKAKIATTTSVEDNALLPETESIEASEWETEVSRLRTTATQLIDEINVVSRRLKFSTLPIWHILADTREIERKIEKHNAERRNLPHNMVHKVLYDELANRRAILERQRTQLAPLMLVELHKDLSSFKDEVFPKIVMSQQQLIELKEEVTSLRQSPLSMDHLRTSIKESIATYTPQLFEKRFDDLQRRIEGLAKQHQDTRRCEEPANTMTTMSPLEPNCREYIKALDFRAPFGMWRWGNADWQIAWHTLWHSDEFNYMIRFHEPKPVCLERHERGHDYDHNTLDYAKPPNLALYSQYIMELEVDRAVAVEFADIVPRYVLCVGRLSVEVLGVGDRPSYETSANNLYLVMDVTKPAKALWLVYKYEYRNKKGKVSSNRLYTDRAVFPHIEEDFDLALVMDDISKWNENDYGKRIEDTMRSTACCARPVFTRPKLSDLLRAIEEGWAGYTDP